MSYDLFVSYARQDNQSGRVSDLLQRIQTDYRGFAGEELHCFFDLTDIKTMDDWRDRILGGLRESHLLLLVLSPAYLASPYCEWEIVEFLKYEHSRAVQGQGVAQIYFVEIPGLDTPGFEQQAAAWLARVRHRNHCDLRPWFDEGSEALKRADVRERLADLERSLHDRLTRLRRIERAPGNLPAHNPRFVGRQEEMQRLHQAAGRGAFGVLTAVHGVGGLGKTALAIQYAYSFADFYPGGRWLIGCAGRDNLAAAIRSLDVDLGLTLDEEEKRDDTRAAKRILAELEKRANAGAQARAGEKNQPEPCALLLLDNVDSPALLQPPQADLLTGRKWLHVLATTRLGPKELGADPHRHQLLAVDNLPEEDALLLIESYQPRGRFASEDERAAATGIVKLLGGFTLAVEVVAVYLGECEGRVTCAAFLQRLQGEGLTGLETAAKGTVGAVAHEQKLISLTLEPTLKTLSPAENLVLTLAALLPPDSVPLPWLRAVAAQDYPELAQDVAPGHDDPWLTLVNHLISLRLLQVVELADDGRTPRICRIHRLVQKCLKQRRGDTAAHLENRLIQNSFTRSEYLEEHWHETTAQWEIRPLLTLVTQLLNQTHVEAPKLVKWLMQWIGFWIDSNVSESLLRRSLAQQEADPKTDITEIAITLSNLGHIISTEAHYTEAESLLRRALAIDMKHREPTHQFIAIRLHNLAQVLENQGKFTEAESLLREALKVNHEALPSGHPSIAKSQLALAGVLKNQDKLAEAEPLLRESLESLRKGLPAGHPAIAASLGNLAGVLYLLDKFAEAEPLFREALELYRNALPAEHPSIATALNNLASILRALGKLNEAESLFRQSLELRRKAFPAGHPDTASTLSNLASLLHAKGEMTEAESLLLESVEIRRKALSERHPDIAVTLNNLASLFRDQNRLAEAEPLYREAVEILRSALPAGHTRIAIILNGFAMLLQTQDKLIEAEPLFREALAIREKALGLENPDTLSSLSALADLLDKKGDFAEADKLHQQALEAKERKLGSEHPDAVKEMNNYAYRMRKSDRPSLAKSYDQKVLEVSVKTLGNAHPFTVHRRNNHILTLIMLGELAKAQQLLGVNSQSKAPQYANTTPRVVFLRAIVALLEGHPTALFLGQLKTLIASEPLPVMSDVQVPWDITYFVEYLRPKLPADAINFLTALVTALNDRTKLSELDRFPEWRDVKPLPLDMPWPET